MYDQTFFDQINEGSIRSARIILKEFFDGLGYIPNSIVDIGCGEGAWLYVAEQMGVSDIFGYDGSYIDPDRSLIRSDQFLPADLSKLGWPHTEEKFDIAISLEVAEHLPESSADHFVEMLCEFSDIILFSAAIPGQGGVGHINEQWPSYWVKKFWKSGYSGTDLLRWIIWDNPDVENWYKQNIIVFRKSDIPGKILDVVHPANWKAHYLDKL
jgi:hypothetical protein